MKLKASLLLLSCLMPATLWGQWKSVGNADYNWGPFHVYTVSLYSETGSYQENLYPLMLSFKYAKPIEGKNFAISLVKEFESLKFDKANSSQWLKKMQEIFPDFSSNDVLSYISLGNKGYFVLNDTVLDYEFDGEFDRAMLAIWLSPKSNYLQLQNQLMGKEKSAYPDQHLLPQPETQSLDGEEMDPQLPPNFEQHFQHKGNS